MIVLLPIGLAIAFIVVRTRNYLASEPKRLNWFLVRTVVMVSVAALLATGSLG